MADTELQQLAKTDRNPVQESRYQELLRQQGANQQSSGGNVPSAIDLMKQAQAFQIEQNQPAIATLTAQKTSLADQYKTLLDSVIGQGSVAMNTATSGENAFLASRGLLSDAGVGNNQLSQAQQAVQAQNQSAAAQVGMGSAQDINALAAQIAGLQAGNVGNAQGFASNIAGLQNALQLQQLKNQAPFSTNGLVYNPSTGGFSSPPASTPAASPSVGGGGGGGGAPSTNTTSFGPPSPTAGNINTSGNFNVSSLTSPSAINLNSLSLPKLSGNLGLGTSLSQNFYGNPNGLHLQ